MKNLFILLLAICCLSNLNFDAKIHMPPQERQITDQIVSPYGKRPEPINGDICRKWINQKAISVVDIYGKWHYHPEESVCYQRASQVKYRN